MKPQRKIYLISIVLISALIMFTNFSFGQEAQQPKQETSPAPEEATQPQAEPSTAAETPQQPATTPQPETQWLWGEVVSLDTKAGQLVLKYIDYETDTEKNITIDTNADTVYENAAGLADIKQKDTASIDYVVAADGKNLAKHISLEKVESLPEETAAPSSEPSVPAATETAPKE